jgi:hypothetical protein
VDPKVPHVCPLTWGNNNLKLTTQYKCALFIFKWWFVHQWGMGKKVSNVGVGGKIVGKQWLFLGNGDHGLMANAQKSQ